MVVTNPNPRSIVGKLLVLRDNDVDDERRVEEVWSDDNVDNVDDHVDALLLLLSSSS